MTCHLVTLARNQIVHLQRCEHCGCVSMHLGAITVRLDEDSLKLLGVGLMEGADALDRDRRTELLSCSPRGLC